MPSQREMALLPDRAFTGLSTGRACRGAHRRAGGGTGFVEPAAHRASVERDRVGEPAPLTRRLARATTLLRRAVALVAHVPRYLPDGHGLGGGAELGAGSPGGRRNHCRCVEVAEISSVFCVSKRIFHAEILYACNPLSGDPRRRARTQLEPMGLSSTIVWSKPSMDRLHAPPVEPSAAAPPGGALRRRPMGEPGG